MTNPHQKLNRLITGAWVAQAIALIVRLEIPDLLAKEAQSAEALAKQVDADSDSLKRVLRALKTVDVIHEDEHGRYSLAELGELLRTDIQGSHAAMAAMNGDLSHWLPWGESLEAVKTGKPVAEKVFGKSMWDYLAENQDQQTRFNNAMTDTSHQVSHAIAKSYDFSKFNKLVDYGGGHGLLLKTILKKFPALEGILFDLPHVIETAEIEPDYSSRITCTTGSFLDTAPGGGDIYIMKHIIHDWGDQEALKILKNIREVIPDNGRVLIAETVLSDHSSDFATWLDLNMMVILGGRERTEVEFSDLYNDAGFECLGVIETDAHVSLIEGSPC